MARKECEIGHRLYDVLGAAHPNDSFVFSPHAIYASFLISLAAGNDAHIQRALATSQGELSLADVYAQLRYAHELYQSDPSDNELERRFPVQQDLAITLRVRDSNRLAPEFLALIHAAEIPVSVANQPGLASEPSQAGELTLHADSTISAPWLEMPFGERVGTFREAGSGLKEARFVRFRGVEMASLPEFPARVTIDAGIWPEGLDVKFISIAEGHPTSDFCARFGDGDEWLTVFTEIPETAITTLVGAAESATALAGMVEAKAAERYSCADRPDAHANVTERASRISLSSRNSVAFTGMGVSWTKPGPQPSDLPPTGDVQDPLYTFDLHGPTRTFTFDAPFQFAITNKLGLIEAVGRVSNLARSR